MLILKVLLIVALIKMLMINDKPLVCAGIYAGISFLLGLAMGNELSVMLIAALIGFGLAALYFWLLSRFEDSGLVWWGILIGGLAIGLV